mmetsp:Transcript_20479/g.38087  ORF Transcript_20479/g.38087 Transcript_20479/m.38087 type:complete len:536 (+) Transcript_20479:2-1609(+)
MSVNRALELKVKLSVGLAPTEGPRFTSDLKNDNARAEARRQLVDFEQKLGAYDSESDEEVMSPRGGAAIAELSWSDQAHELDEMAKTKRTRKFGKMSTIEGFIRDLRLQRCRITSIGPDVCRLSQLEELDVSGNKLVDVDALPPRLIMFQAYDNAISRFRVESPCLSETLLFVGLGYNKLAHTRQWAGTLSAVRSLDLCFNDLCDFDETMENLACLRHLQELRLDGNPIALLPGYHERVLSALPNLTSLDGIPRCPVSLENGQYNTAPNDIVVQVAIGEVKISLQKPTEDEEDGELSAEHVAAQDESEQEQPHIANSVAVEALMPQGKTLRTPFVPITLPEEGTSQSEESGGNSVNVTVDFEKDLVYFPSTALRDHLESPGLVFRLIIQTIVSQSSPASENEPAEAEDGEPKLEILSETEVCLGEASLDVSGFLTPSVAGHHAIKQNELRVESERSRLVRLIGETAQALPDPTVHTLFAGDGSKITVSAALNPLPEPEEPVADERAEEDLAEAKAATEQAKRASMKQKKQQKKKK